MSTFTREIQTAQLESFVRLTPVNALVTMLASLVTGAILWSVTPSTGVALWVGLQWALAIWMLLRWMRHTKEPWDTGRAPSPGLLRRVRGLALVSGGLWGGAVLLLEGSHGPEELAVSIVVTAMAAGSATTLAALPGVAVLFIASALVPLAAHFLVLGDPVHLGLALLALGLALAMVGSSRLVYRIIHEKVSATGRAEELLEEIRSERQDWLAISELSEAYALFDPQERLLEWSGHYARTLGISEGMLELGASREDLLRAAEHPKDVGHEPKAVEAWISRHRRLPDSDEDEFLEEYPGGRWIRTRASRTEAGGVVVVHGDVTDLRRAQTEATGARELLLDAIEGIPEIVAVWDRDDRLSAFNAAVKEYYPALADRIEIGMSFEELTRAAVDSRFVDTSLQGEAEIQRRIERHRKADGTPWVTHLASGKTLQVTETRTREGGVVAVTADLTRIIEQEAALRESEERFQSFFGHSPSPISLKDLEEVFRLVNAAFLDLHGVEEAEVLGRTSVELHGDDLGKRAMRLDAEVLTSGLPREDELELNPTDGKRQIHSITRFPVFGRDGEPLGVGAVGHNVTAQRDTEAQLRQAQKLETLGQLTGGVAHDFNNLLTIIMGNLETARVAVGRDGRGARNLRAALDAVERGARLTSQLLSYSRRQALHPQPVYVQDMVADMTDLLGRALGDPVKVEVAEASDLPPALVDAGQLQNALINLSLNARDAMPGGGTLHIETCLRSLSENDLTESDEAEPGDYIVATVRDEGVGMSEDTMARAFEPFFSTKGVGGGSGLGLSMVFGFIQQSEGLVRVQSAPGQGTSVELFLPVTTPAVAAPEQVSVEGASGGHETVVVVEDESGVRELVRGVLGDVGYRIHTVEDGSSALALLSRLEKVDLLLSDVRLSGGMDGFQLALEVGRLRPDLRVMFMSGDVRMAEGLMEGRDSRIDVLAKPFRVDVLLDRVRRTLDGPRD